MDFTSQDLILYFTNGLGREDARMIISACGGDIQNKTIAQAQSIIEDLAASSRHFRAKPKSVSSMENATHFKETVGELKKLGTIRREMMQEMKQEKVKAQVCGVCESPKHRTMECPSQNFGNEGEQVFGAWENKQNSQPSRSQNNQGNQFPNNYNNQPSQNQQSTEEMIRSLASTVATLQTSMTNLETKLEQISDTVNQTIPKNPTPNPNVSAVTTRSGRELEVIVKNPTKKPRIKR